MRRRDFLRNSILTAGALSSANIFAQSSQSKPEIAIFTKPFQHLTYSDFSNLLAEIGASGPELPVRPKGHIEPQAVGEELPKMIDALKKNNLKISIIASGINSTGSAHAEKTLRTAKALGISHFRMSYYKYDLKKPIAPQLESIKSQMKDLAAMCKDIGIKAVYQNHSGANYFGAPLWDLYSVLKEINSEYMGAALDCGHLSVESGKSWEIQQKVLEPYTSSIYVKDYIGVNKTFNKVPLGQGMVKKKFFDNVKKTGFTGPYSLHVEYFSHKDQAMTPKFIEAFKNDIVTLKSYIG